MDRTLYPRCVLEGYDAFQMEGTGELQYNPYDFGEQHDQWDYGYQLATDEASIKTERKSYG